MTRIGTDVLVIGGGAMGASVAFHTARAGLDTVVLEAYEIGDGTTSYSAGMVGQLRARRAIGELITHSARLYARLETERPGSIGFAAVGSLRLATNAVRLAEFEDLVSLGLERGINAELVTADRLRGLSPLLRTDDVLGACWVPSDGQAEPVALARGLIEWATEAGARVFTGSPASQIETTSTGFRVTVPGGVIDADRIVLAAGVHTAVLAARLGITVPILASKQQAMLTRPIPGGAVDFPTLREPDRDLIMRASGDRLLVGSYAKNPEIVHGSEVPLEPRFGFEPELERMEPAWQAAVDRIPSLAGVGWESVVKAADAATADTELILGETGLPGLWIASGGNGHGIASAGGAGWFIAGSLATGVAPIDGTDFALERFSPELLSDEAALFAATRSAESKHYALTEVES